jgi:hypothetical protein
LTLPGIGSLASTINCIGRVKVGILIERWTARGS